MQLRLASAYVAAHRQQLADEQRPVASLLAGLATMARRPPLLALADEGGTDELVKVRILLDSTLPVIRGRTSRLVGQLAEGERLQRSALAARAELVAQPRRTLSPSGSSSPRSSSTRSQRALASGGQALGAGDIAIAAGEDVERLRGDRASNRSMRALAAASRGRRRGAGKPVRPRGPRAASTVRLPAAGRGARHRRPGAVNASGVRSRGVTLATARGTPLTAPADGHGPLRRTLPRL